MFVKIIKCSSENYWYRDLVGKEFEIEKIDKNSNSYIVENIDGKNTMMGSLFFEDCEEIQDISNENAWIPPIPSKTKEEIMQETLDMLILNSL